MAEEVLGNARIDQHPLGVPTNNDFGIYRDMGNAVTKRFAMSQFLSSNTSTNVEWTTAKRDAGDYDIGVIATRSGDIYQSTIDDNPNTPGSETIGLETWTKLTQGKSGLTYYVADVVYTQDDVFTVKDIYDEPFLFRLISVTRPYHTTDFEAELAIGDWELVGKTPTVIPDAEDPSNIITLDFKFLSKVNFAWSAGLEVDKTINLINPIEGSEGNFRFILSGTTGVIFDPVIPKMMSPSNADWTSPVWTPLEPGEYNMHMEYINLGWRIEISGPII